VEYSHRVSNHEDERPPLTDKLSGAEFRRWYWLKAELAGFAGSLGVRATGSKQVLTDRISAKLDGHPFTEPAIRRQGGKQLTGPLTDATVIPAGQRCSQAVRAWLTQRIGPDFHFDGGMREFFAGADGTQTLAGAVEHWHRTRDRGHSDIEPQFEYNRFTRAWHAANPNGTRDALLAAWRLYRSRPVDDRDRAQL
jgi:hypothetical protein